MPKKKKRLPNYFINKPELLLTMLRHLMDGYWTRQDFAQIGIPVKSYDDLLACIKRFIPDKDMRKQQLRWSFPGNSYASSNNPFAFVFTMRSFGDKNIKALVYICGELNESPVPMKHADFVSPSIKNFPLNLPDIDGRIVSSCLKELQEYGAIQAEKKSARRVYYKLVPSPLSSLSEEELRALIPAVDFYKHVWLFSFPGYLLQRKLEILCHRESPVWFQFPSQHNEALLQEDKLLILLECIKRKKGIHFSYTNETQSKGKKGSQKQERKESQESPDDQKEDKRTEKSVTDLFTAIITDCRHGRDKVMGHTPFILGKMDDLSESPEKGFESPQSKTPKIRSIPAELYFHSPTEKEQLLRELDRQFVHFTHLKDRDTDHSMVVTLESQDVQNMVPAIQSFGASMKVLNFRLTSDDKDVDATQTILGYITGNIQEALKNYGEV